MIIVFPIRFKASYLGLIYSKKCQPHHPSSAFSGNSFWRETKLKGIKQRLLSSKLVAQNICAITLNSGPPFCQPTAKFAQQQQQKQLGMPPCIETKNQQDLKEIPHPTNCPKSAFIIVHCLLILIVEVSFCLKPDYHIDLCSFDF